MNDVALKEPADELEALARDQDERRLHRHVVVKDTPPGSEWNAVENALLRRRSIRKFKARQVPDYLIRRILEIARYAPSQGNCQPWSFVVVRDKSMIAQMEAYCVAVCKAMSASLDYTHYAKGSWKRFITMTKTRFANRSRPNALHPIPMTAMKNIACGRFAVFHRAPTVILILMDKRGVGKPEIDIGIVGQNIVAAAQSHGLGTCWVGFSTILNSSKDFMDKFGVTPPFEIAEAISIGYPIGDPTQNEVQRQTHEIVWWEGGKKEIRY